MLMPTRCAQTLLGMDVDCGHFVAKNLQEALDQQYIKESDVDLALEHLFSLRLRLGASQPHVCGVSSAQRPPRSLIRVVLISPHHGRQRTDPR